MAVFETSINIACDTQTAFDFLCRPANHARISPPSLSLRFTDAPEVIVLGSHLTFEVTNIGQTQQITHEITAISEFAYTESQVDGPMRSWIHEHVVTHDAGGCAIIDRIEFEPPGGMLGFLVTENRIRETLQAGFEHSHPMMKQLLESDNT